MKPRLPSAEERKLWRESNRHTNRFAVAEEPDDEGEEEVAAVGAATPAQPEPRPLQRKQATSPLPAPLSALSTREANKRFRSYPIDATLDLHGATKLEALTRVQHFIHHQHRAHRRHVVIITGKGRGGETGVLRAHLPHWLNEPPLRLLISAFAHARPEKGGTGVMHVLLKAL